MTCPTVGNTAHIALGSNLGNRLTAMRAAVAALDAHPRIRVDLPSGVASLYESAAVVPGLPANNQSAYLNSAVRAETTLSPRELLRAVLDIEATLGRVRRDRWEARVIDIDLLLYGDFVCCDEDLTLPHPRLHERLFVLEPLAEIAGDLLHPTLRTDIALLTRNLTRCGQGTAPTSIAGPQWVQIPR